MIFICLLTYKNIIWIHFAIHKPQLLMYLYIDMKLNVLGKCFLILITITLIIGRYYIMKELVLILDLDTFIVEPPNSPSILLHLNVLNIKLYMILLNANQDTILLAANL